MYSKSNITRKPTFTELSPPQIKKASLHSFDKSPKNYRRKKERNGKENMNVARACGKEVGELPLELVV